MGHLCSDLNLPIIVFKMAAATLEKLKEKWAGLIHRCNREIEIWKWSGQGDGGYDIDNEEDDEDGGGRQWEGCHDRSKGQC